MASPSGGHTGGLSPNTVKTGIDTVMYERYGRTLQPAYLSADDVGFFKQGSTVGISFIWEEDSNVGEFIETDEQEDFENTDTFTGNKTTVDSQKYIKQIPISDEAFKADLKGKRDAIGRNVGDRARQTRDRKAILNVYGDAFAGTVFTTPDGQALASNSHTTLTGFTVDNLETGVLNADNLWTSTNSLAQQEAQDGDAGSHVFDRILVPFTLYKTTKETMDSTLVPFSAENQINIFETSDYGNVTIRASVFLNSKYNSATNANTSFHVLSEDHMIHRKVFYELETTLIPPEHTTNHSYQLRSHFHEITFPGSWTGGVHNNGTV